MHGFRKGRFRYIGRSLPCIRLSPRLYLSKITWLNVFMESQYTGFYFETTFLFFLLVTREEAGGSGGASCVLSALKPTPAPRMRGQALLSVPQVQQAVKVELMTR